MKKALITGVTGQDGSYLAELLLEKEYKVYGIVRRTSTFNRSRIDHLRDNNNFELLYGDLGDSTSINTILREVMPDEVYNLAAQSHVRISFDIPEYTGDVDTPVICFSVPSENFANSSLSVGSILMFTTLC